MKRLPGSLTRLAGFVLAAALLAASQASAITITWNGNVDSDWFNGANWGAGSGPVPAAGDTTWFVAGAPIKTINIGSPTAALAGVQFQQGDYTFNGSGPLGVDLLQNLSGTNSINTVINSAAFTGTVSGGQLNANNPTNTVAGGTWTVSNNSRLKAIVNGAGSGLGAANVTLNGSTLELAGLLTNAPGLKETIFNGTVGDAQGNIEAFRTASLTLGASDAQGVLTGQLHYQDDAAVSTRAAALGAVGFDNGDFAMLWVSDFTPTENGQWGFRTQGGGVDDNMSFWVDTDGNGTFEIANRFYNRGCCGDTGDQYTPALTAGTTYKMGIVMNDGGGGGYLRDVEVKAPSGGWTDLTPSALGNLFTTFQTANATLSNSVAVTGASSTINVSNASAITMDSLSIAAGGLKLTKTGPGSVTFTQASTLNNINSASVVQVDQGTLAMVSKGTSPLNGADLILNGGTFTVQGNATSLATWNAPIQERYYANRSAASLADIDAPAGVGLLNWTYAVDQLLDTALNFNDAALNSRNGPVLGSDNFSATWRGTLSVTADGVGLPVRFWTDTDDAGVIFIDLNKNGDFEPSEMIVNGNWDQGAGAPETGTATFTSAGNYDVVVGYNEGGGGYSALAKFAVDGTPFASAAYMGPGASLQVVAGINMSDTDVLVQKDSTLNAFTDTVAAFGHLTFTPLSGGSAILTTNGPNQKMTFLDTVITAPGTVGFNTKSHTYPGVISGGGFAATIVKAGASDLFLHPGNNGLQNALFDVQAGRIVGVGLGALGNGNPGAGAKLRLSGGSTWAYSAAALDVVGGVVPVPNAIDITGDSTISASQFTDYLGNAGLAGLPVRLNDLAITAGTLTLTGQNGYSFVLPGTRGNGANITGAGGLAISAGTTVTIPGPNLDLSRLDIAGTLNITNTPLNFRIGNYLRLQSTATNDLDFTGGTFTTNTNNTQIEIGAGRKITMPAGMTTLQANHIGIYQGNNTQGELVLRPDATIQLWDWLYMENYSKDTQVPWNLVNYAGANSRTEFRSGTLDKSFVLTGTNTYTQTTQIDRGALWIPNIAKSLAPGVLRLQGDSWDTPAILMSSGTFTRTLGWGAGQVVWENNGGGFAAKGGKFTIDLGGDGTGTGPAIAWDGDANGFRGRTLMFGFAQADNRTEFMNSIVLRTSNNENYMSLFGNPATDQDIATVTGTISGTNIAQNLRIRGTTWGGGSGFSSKGYEGTVEFAPRSGSNTYVQRTVMDEGVLRAVDGVGLPAASRLYFEADYNTAPAVFESHGTFTRKIGNTDGVSNLVFWGGPGGFSAYDGKLTVTLQRADGASAPLLWGDASQGFNGQNLQFGSSTANNVVEMTNSIDGQAGDRAIYVFNNPHSVNDYALMSGQITNVSNFYKRGDGLLQITNLLQTNNATYVDEGTLKVSGTVRTGNNNNVMVRNASTLIIAGPNAIDGDEDLRLESGSLLRGNGGFKVDDDVEITSGTILSPGNIRSLPVQISGGMIVMQPGISGTLAVQVGDPPASGNVFHMYTGSIYEWDLSKDGKDVVNIVGDLQLDANWILRLFLMGGEILPTQQIDLFTYTGIAGMTNGQVVTALLQYGNLNPDQFAIWDDSQAKILNGLYEGGGGHVYLTGLYATPIPEPATLCLLGLGTLALLRRRRRALGR